MSNIQEYTCPCCGGGIAFDSQLQKMKCPYCDTEFEMETLEAYDNVLSHELEEDMTWDDEAGSQWDQEETSGLKTYTCSVCGGEIIGDADTAATSCPYCGNPVVMMGNLAGALKPDYVIPFKIDKEAAKAALKNHYKGKRLLPRVFLDENHIDEIKGVYVPFWLFDADVEAQFRYRTTRIRHWFDQDYNYTETSFFSVGRVGTIGFDHVPVAGSSKMTDELMESVEPYDFSEAVDFQTAYLAGYLADKYDIPSQESIARANERIRRTVTEAFQQTVMGYDHVETTSSNLNLINGMTKYAFYPVWLLNTKWNDQIYTFAINGQTGKIVGDLPSDNKASAKWFFGIGGITAAVVFALSYLMWLF